MPGRRAISRPSRAEAPSGRSRCQDLDGQNIARPVTARRAGRNVTPARAITITEMAMAGPRTLNAPYWARPSVAKATATASAAEKITAPTRAEAAAAAGPRASPARRRSRKRKMRNRK
jgi:hypothetical protein